MLRLFTSVSIFFDNVFNFLLNALSVSLPYVIKYLIGYCHFYYQLGYGLIFYIYFFRRYRAKKVNNWKSFYGNSVLNWLLFNISIFNKFLFNRSFIIYIKTLIIKLIQVTQFAIQNSLSTNTYFNRSSHILFIIYKKINLYSWTPIFKRSSYIWFTTFLKRFTKRK
jgi:hypothetical protein